MSIYNPPSKTQSVFNPSNYGGLGAGGQITTDYLDANFVKFPVAQGNTTLVGTNILGDVTQQGDFSITGDVLVNDVNVITEIGTKQDELTSGTNISIVDNIVSCDLTGSINIDITGGVISATGLQNELTAGTNISIVDNEVSCDLTAGKNISIDAFTSEISCDLTAGENIDITDGVISSTGGGTTIDNTTDLDVNTLTSVGNISVGGLISSPNQISFRARRQGDELISTSVHLPYNVAVFNIGGAYNATTYEFTAPISGTYFFYVSFFRDDNNSYMVDIIQKTTTTEIKQERFEQLTTGAGGLTKIFGSVTFFLDAGDIVYTKRTGGIVRLSDGGNGAALTNFGGHFLG